MIVEAGDDILGGQGLAVVELNALADVEHPGLGIRGWLKGLRQFTDQFTGVGHLGEVVAAGEDHAGAEAVFGGRRIQHVGGGAVPGRHPEQAAPLGR